MSSLKKGIFNYSQKLEYLEYEGTNTVALTNYFRRISDKESEYNKDISIMNREELKDTLASLGIRSEYSRIHLISLLRQYINWTRINGKAINNGAIDEIKAESIESNQAIREQMIKDPEQVDEILDKAIEHGYYLQENRAARDSLVFWLMYSGMLVKDLCVLKKRDVNVEKRIIKCENGKEYLINENIVPIMNKCLTMEYVEKAHKKSKSDIATQKLIDNEYLFRPIQGSRSDNNLKCKEQHFYGIVYRIVKEYYEATGVELSLSPLIIRLSGVFFRLYKLEQEGNEITLEIIANYLGIECSDKDTLHNRVGRWVADYKDWKLAFGYGIIFEGE